MDHRRILFVDDEPGIRQTLPPILQAHGFELTPAADVVEALELIQKEKFDVLLTDLAIVGGIIELSQIPRLNTGAYWG